MSWHISPKTGNPARCRAKISCPFGAEDVHYATQAQAWQAFENSMHDKTVPIPEAQKKQFAVFHGSSVSFDTFDPSFTGQGNDSYGSGFYFSTSESIAQSYGETKAHTVTLQKPLVIDGFEHMSLNHVMLSQEQAEKILLQHPALYAQPTDEELNNPLSDWSEAYWAKDEHSKDEMRTMMKAVVKKYFAEGIPFTELEGMFGRAGAHAFRTAASEVTGWDGVIVNFERPEDGSHVIAWFPEQITSR